MSQSHESASAIWNSSCGWQTCLNPDFTSRGEPSALLDQWESNYSDAPWSVCRDKKTKKEKKTSATWWLVLHFCLFWLNILLSLHVVWLHLTTFCWWVTQNWLKYSTFLLLIKDIFVDPGEQVPSKWTFVSNSWQYFQICSHIFSCSDVLITMVLINPITHIQLIFFFFFNVYT